MLRALLRAAAWLLLLAIIIFTVDPIGLRPQLGFGPDFDRAFGFLVVGFAFTVAYPKRWRVTLVLLVIGAFAIEALQLITPDRHARIHDALIKAASGAFGIIGGHILLSRWNALVLHRERKLTLRESTDSRPG